MTDSYYTLKQRTHDGTTTTAIYDCNIHAQGAWNPHEQHMAPATGLMCAELEAFMPREDMRFGRISLDIFGLILFGEFTVETKIMRAGRTIDLIESVMRAKDKAGVEKTCIVARAWRLQKSDTTSVAGTEDAHIGSPDDYPDWHGMKHWGGGYIDSIYTKAHPDNRHGSGIVWINNDLDMVSYQGKPLPTSDFVHLMGMVDTANGVTPRIHQPEGIVWAFPNLDLQIHLLRLPVGRWLGLQTIQQIHTDGIGLTSSILHDEQGPFGRSEQILTVRKIS